MKLQNTQPAMIAVPALFFDEYMPAANGEFVKVYLCLYRLCQKDGAEVSVSAIGDALNHTDADILRGIRYWEHAGLLDIVWADRNTPEEITFIIPDASAAPVSESVTADRSASAKMPADDTAAASEARTVTPVTAAPARAFSAPKEQTPGANTPAKPAAIMQDLSSDDGFSDILFVAQHLLGKLLSASETEQLGYWYRLYPNRPEVIEYLIEYCADQGHTRFSYMEKVLLNWHQLGLTSLEEVRDHVKSSSSAVRTVMKEFGIKDRTPGKKEMDAISRWFRDYGFSEEMVAAAIRKTLTAIQKPSFEYTERILADWHAQGVKDLAAAEAADSEHRRKAASTKQSDRPAAKRQSGTRFSNFEQRRTDYDALEDALFYSGQE